MLDKNQERILMTILSGSISGIIVRTIVAPIDRLRIIYQVNRLNFTYRFAYFTFRRILRDEGFSALFRGNSATALRILPYFGTQFFLHEQLKSAFDVRTYEQKKANPYMSMSAGALAGAIANIVTYPLDVARARLATDRQYKSVYSVFRKAFTSKDARYGLYRGLSASLLAVIPYSGMSFHLYEHLKQHYLPQCNCPRKTFLNKYVSCL